MKQFNILGVKVEKFVLFYFITLFLKYVIDGVFTNNLNILFRYWLLVGCFYIIIWMFRLSAIEMLNNEIKPINKIINNIITFINKKEKSLLIKISSLTNKKIKNL